MLKCPGRESQRPLADSQSGDHNRHPKSASYLHVGVNAGLVTRFCLRSVGTFSCLRCHGTYHLDRYHEIKIAPATVYNVLRRKGLNRLPRNAKKRTITTHRYEKQVPGHHIQVDVKFLKLREPRGGLVKRFQYTAIDDATRIRALKIYNRHTQQNAIRFIDDVIRKFPFRIQTIRTDNGHEFQAVFHWHVEDMGIRHIYIKPRRPNLNGKVERSHGTDEREFYQLLTYTDDVDLNKKLLQWEDFYNLNRPHGGLNGKTPYEILREKLQSAQDNVR